MFASVVIIILICYILTHPRPRRPSDNMCMLICFCNLAMLLGDIPNWLCEGYARPWYPAVLHIGIFIQFLGGILVMPAYTFYIKVHLASRVQVSRKIIRTVLAIGGTGVILLVVNLFNGMFYYIDSNNVYHRGEWWILTQLMSVAIMLIDLSMELYYRRYMRRKDIIIFQGYKVLPLTAVIIQSMFYGIAATYPAVTISILLIFLNIQSEQAFLLEQQESRLTQSRIAIMMSQIQPHFLFNALTGIKQLCDTDPKKASVALEHFSYFLRGNLDSLSDSNLITFDKELEHVQDYLYLEKLRFEDRLNIHMEIETTDFLLPSLTLLQGYENDYGINASLIDQDGIIEISTTYTGYEKMDWFEAHDQEPIRRQVLGWNKGNDNLELWTGSQAPDSHKSYVVSRYIPELSWDLVVEQDTDHLIEDMNRQLYRTGLILAAVIITVVIVITNVIRNFDRQITKLTEERQAIFKKATEQLYDSIYELNLTRNCYVGKPTEEYFASMGAGGMPFDQGLRVIAEKQIKEEYREGYVSMFSPEHVIREYEAGNNHLSYDFMLSLDGGPYQWMRVETYIFFSEEDKSIHMFAYRKNIDTEKKRELQAATDEMTGLFTKKVTERLIDRQLTKCPGGLFAFMIFDIDCFKDVNDHHGHAFGDYCICTFTKIIKEHFRDGDIIGRIGGDEFVVFIPVPGVNFAEVKAAELSSALDTVISKEDVSCHISASIGVSVSPRNSMDFEALYQTKQRGKNGFTLFEP